MTWKMRNFVSRHHHGQMYGEQTYCGGHLIPVSDLAREIADRRGLDMATLDKVNNIALCHDILEDTNCTEQELESYIGTSSTEVVKLLTKVPQKTYEQYIDDILEDELATIVKIADTMVNLQTSVLGNQKGRVHKYSQQLMLLHKKTGVNE